MKNNIEFEIKLNNQNIEISTTKIDSDLIYKYYILHQVSLLFKDANKTHNSSEINKSIETMDGVLNDIKPLILDYLNQNKISDITVKNKFELYNLKHTFIKDGKIIKRKEGLKVYIESENKIYQLINGVDNKNWKPIK